MIALFQIALPFELLILPDERLPTLSYKGDTVLKRVGEFQLIVEPPYRSQRPDQNNVHDPWVEPNPNAFNPADPQPVDADVELNGKAAVRCDAIAVQIIAADFDRRRGVPFDTVDRLLALACDAANGVLQRIRVLTRAPHMKPLDPEAVAYRLVFLDDSGEPIAPDAERFSETFNASLRIQMTAVTPTTWQQAVDLGDYETPRGTNFCSTRWTSTSRSGILLCWLLRQWRQESPPRSTSSPRAKSLGRCGRGFRTVGRSPRWSNNSTFFSRPSGGAGKQKPRLSGVLRSG